MLTNRILIKINKFLKINHNLFSICKKFNNSVKLRLSQPFKLHLLDTPPNAEVKLTKDEAINLYKRMSIIRRMELTCSQMYKEKLMRGFCHLYSGQEAIAVGIVAAMRNSDCAITSYRSHSWTWLMGVSVEKILAELCGRTTGCSRGKGGSMHTYATNFFGGNGIVGAQVPLGTGIGLKIMLSGKDDVCFTIYGDGAANQGQVFEAFNMAKLWALPVVYVCENNKYGMGTSIERAAANNQFYTRGDFVPGIQVDGMDVLACREAAHYAIAHCVAKKGPIILECITYRYFGHSMSDPGTSYRTRDEVQDVRQSKDPIILFKNKIISAKLVTEDDIKNMDMEIKTHVDEETEKAKKGPFPPVHEIGEDIQSNFLEKYIRGVTPWAGYKHKNVGQHIPT